MSKECREEVTQDQIRSNQDYRCAVAYSAQSRLAAVACVLLMPVWPQLPSGRAFGSAPIADVDLLLCTLGRKQRRQAPHSSSST